MTTMRPRMGAGDREGMTMDFQQHKAMLAALEAVTATPDQQRAAFAHLQAIKRQHNQDLRDEQREAQAAYREGRWDAASEARGEPYGTY